ncbi:hypothetical protein K491DRAFT_682782 [Lophiostoma macrostomum CBS 122681]|uniref:Uncharacterized protein n=1 Tax=Lophiostoma macrostomum CBS 122681 TaxID=1314788 RepID=A0A6A6SSS9_9PLEO|nr:hypothetical protein K491DRAFT_682782 [Lophiostoma macrostomum CBS 122681]
MFQRLSFTFLILQLIPCYAWELDDSGSKSSDYVTAGVKGALEMNRAARSAVDAAELTDQTKGLLKILFEPDATDSNNLLSIVKPELSSTFASLSIEGSLSPDIAVYRKIAEMEVEGDTTGSHFSLTSLPTQKIYCDTKRFTKRSEDEGRWYDQGTNAVVSDDDGGIGFNPVESCKSPNINLLNPEFTDNIFFAFTLTSGQHFAITICPWYLDFAAQNNLKASYSFKTWTKSKLLKWFEIDRRVTAHFFFSEVDMMSLFDKIMLHERGSVSIIDVGGIDGYGMLLELDRHSQSELTVPGWNNVRKLAGGVNKFDNADSYALFGSCCKLVEDGY